MLISYNLKKIEQLRNYPERELAIAKKIDNDLRYVLQTMQQSQSFDTTVIEQQIKFIREEQNILQKRKELLFEIYESLSASQREFDIQLEETKFLFQNLEKN